MSSAQFLLTIFTFIILPVILRDIPYCPSCIWSAFLLISLGLIPPCYICLRSASDHTFWINISRNYSVALECFFLWFGRFWPFVRVLATILPSILFHHSHVLLQDVSSLFLSTLSSMEHVCLPLPPGSSVEKQTPGDCTGPPAPLHRAVASRLMFALLFILRTPHTWMGLRCKQCWKESFLKKSGIWQWFKISS